MAVTEESTDLGQEQSCPLIFLHLSTLIFALKGHTDVSASYIEWKYFFNLN